MLVVPIPTVKSWDPLPDKFRCKFHYQNTVKLTVGSAVFGAETVYRLNSLYDPLFSGAGVYPYAFTQFQALYSNYRVHAVTMEILFTDPSVDGIVGGVMVQASNSPLGIAGQTEDWVGARPFCALAPVNNTGSQRVLVRNRFTISQIDGLTQLQLGGDPNYQALMTTNPAAAPYLRVALACNDPLNTTATCFCQIRLIYEAELFARKTL